MEKVMHREKKLHPSRDHFLFNLYKILFTKVGFSALSLKQGQGYTLYKYNTNYINFIKKRKTGNKKGKIHVWYRCGNIDKVTYMTVFK